MNGDGWNELPIIAKGFAGAYGDGYGEPYGLYEGTGTGYG